MRSAAPDRRTAAGVLALVAWGVAEAAHAHAVRPPGAPDPSFALVALAAVLLPLPLLAARRVPVAAAGAVVGMVLGREALLLRPPGSVAQSVILLCAFFAIEGGRRDGGLPWRGLLLGAVLLTGIAVLDLTDRGSYAIGELAIYAHAVFLVLAG